MPYIVLDMENRASLPICHKSFKYCQSRSSIPNLCVSSNLTYLSVRSKGDTVKSRIVCVTVIAALAGISSVNGKTLEEKIDSLIALMSTDEKIEQVSKDGFFTTADNDRLGIPGFFMDDGPHGVGRSKSTCFPVGIAMAATWDRDLIYRTGKVMGTEFQAYAKTVQLGPCVDLCRDPRNGRSAETGGEDPYLCAEAGKYVILGIQSTPTIATVKHFNGVNRQDYRNDSDIEITDKQLMDHYGLSFRRAVQDAGCLSVMNAYNLLNGVHAAHSPHLLQTILRDRWGFPFFVMSDWGAVHDAEEAIEAGTDLCMGSSSFEKQLPNLLSSNAVSQETLDQAVARVLKVKMLSGLVESPPTVDESKVNTPEHRELALEAGRKTIILLKNENGILPLSKNNPPSIALIGPSANEAQLDGFGSSSVKPFYSVSPRDGLRNKIDSDLINYEAGCEINGTDTSRFAKAREKAAAADVVIFVGGLDEDMEGEGFSKGGDRKNGTVQLPQIQQDLISELAKENEKVIVVLKSGGVCALEHCIGDIRGLLYAFYPGQEGGNAIADVLFGDYNPAGRLPVTMPVNDAQLPEWNDDFTDDYGCGYRWFDEKELTPQYPFGYGLSYTTFEYGNLDLSPPAPSLGDSIIISVDVTNTGNLDGEEVVQLYLSRGTPLAPKKELAGFQRATIPAGETKTVSCTLTAESFYEFNSSTDHYEVVPQTVVARMGGSSDNLPLSHSFTIEDGTPKPDLHVLRIYTYPKYPRVGEQVCLMAAVKNSGTAASDSQTEHRIDFMIDDEVVGWSDDLTGGIQAGGMRLISLHAGPDGVDMVSLLSDPVRIGVVVDPDNVIEEHSETNNRFETDIAVIDDGTEKTLDTRALGAGRIRVRRSKNRLIVSGYTAGSTTRIDLVNTQGKTLKTITAVDRETAVDVSHYAKNMLLLRLRDGRAGSVIMRIP